MGGAIALPVGALLLVDGVRLSAIVTFEAPRCGGWKLRRVLSRINLGLYRNGDDPVPDVPWLPGVYMHPRRLVQIGEPAFDPLEDHHIAAYRRALRNLREGY
jgi:hypothetical protein